MAYRQRTRQDVVVTKYLAYKVKGSGGKTLVLLLPLVHVYLKSGEIETTTVALVDSGSTTTFLPSEITELLSLPHVVEESEAVGAGGTFPTFIARLEMLKLIKGVEGFAEFRNVKVHVPRMSGAIPYMVLGRDIVFRRFDITFH